MNDKAPKELMDILKAVPCEEDPDLPFKMPRGNIKDLTLGDFFPKNSRKEKL